MTASLSNITDEDLISMVITTDQELYQQVIMRYEAKLLRYVTYLVRDTDLAVDVVQDTFIKAFVNLRSFDVKRTFSSWLYRIAHNEAMTAVKRAKVKGVASVSLEGDEWVAKTVASDEDVMADMTQADLAVFMRDCLDELPLSYREPLVLFYLEDASYEEISDVLRLSVSAVGVRLARGRKLLQALYIRKGGDRL